jgi:EAL domain-containing protein (putative c-di-GMP-specific phosphodiesterase class I)
MQIDPSYIALEILEYNSISESDYIKEKILELHNLGFEITIDDFGTKCSNFAQIENLPVTIIKIDGQYIKNLDSSQNSKIIAATIKEFAHQKDIKVVAEFVHSKEVLEIVKELGIDYAQGFYLYEPEAEIVKAIN